MASSKSFLACSTAFSAAITAASQACTFSLAFWSFTCVEATALCIFLNSLALSEPIARVLLLSASVAAAFLCATYAFSRLLMHACIFKSFPRRGATRPPPVAESGSGTSGSGRQDASQLRWTQHLPGTATGIGAKTIRPGGRPGIV